MEEPSNPSYNARDTEWARGSAAFYAARAALTLDGEDTPECDALLVASVRTALHTLPYEHWKRLTEVVLVHVGTQRWSMCAPTLAGLRAAPAAVAVAWDSVSDDRSEQSIDELLAAHARAERLGLDWSCPVQRAVAERATDEARLQRLRATR